MVLPASEGKVVDFDRLLAGAALLLKPDFVGVPGRLDAGVVDLEDAAAFLR